MKWLGRRESQNMEDRRGVGSSGKIVAGGGIIGVIILLINLFGGSELQNIAPVLEQFNTSETASERPLTPEEEQQGKMMRVLLADNEGCLVQNFY